MLRTSRGFLQSPRNNFVVDPVILLPQLRKEWTKFGCQSTPPRLYQNACCPDGLETENTAGQLPCFAFVEQYSGATSLDGSLNHRGLTGIELHGKQWIGRRRIDYLEGGG